MKDPQAFCRAVMLEYERQWSCGGGHAVRHPLRLKIERLGEWCALPHDEASFERLLHESCASEDTGTALLADELLPLWRRVQNGAGFSFGDEA